VKKKKSKEEEDPIRNQDKAFKLAMLKPKESKDLMK